MMLAKLLRTLVAHLALGGVVWCFGCGALRAAEFDPTLDEGARPVVEAAERAALPPAEPTAEPTAEPAAEPAAEPPAAKKSGSGQRPKLDAASFKGIQPGRSTTEELAKAWGEPIESSEDGGALSQTYKVESFERVRATIVDGVVSSIVIYLDNPFPPDVLAEQLELDEIPLVEMKDEAGQPLGQAFPERGVMFGYAPTGETPKVSQVLLEPVDAQAFLLRAEATAKSDCASTLADAQIAIDLDPTSARAHSIKAEALFERGEIRAALKAAQGAMSLDADEECQLILAKLLAACADFTQAAQMNEQLLASDASSLPTRARAELQLGDCLARGPSHNYQEAAKHHIKAIKTAERLTSQSTPRERRAAKEILLEAHLGLAYDIGWGAWQAKETAVPKWLQRAKEVADDLAAKEGAGDDALLKFNHGSLAALAGIPKPADASEYMDASMRLGKLAAEKCTDSARRNRLQWELGTAMAAAAQIEHARGKDDNALAYATMAADLLEEGRTAGEHVPGHEHVLGRVFHQIGAIHAIGRNDHKQAAVWYQKAVPLLETPVPPGMANPARAGESFVGMAVSYWEVSNRKEAMRLTLQGSRLMEKAVEDGQLPATALAVAYGNLSSMHAEMGETGPAKKFAELASKSEQSGEQKQ